MTTQNQPPTTRPMFRVLAGILAVLFLVGVCASVSFALDGTAPKPQRLRHATSGALFLFMASAFAYAACTGRWIRKL